MGAILAGISGPIWSTTDELGLFVGSIDKEAVVKAGELENSQQQVVAASKVVQKWRLSLQGKVKSLSSVPGGKDTLVGGSSTIGVGNQFTITDTQFAGTYQVSAFKAGKKQGDWLEITLEGEGFPATSDGSFTTTTTTTT